MSTLRFYLWKEWREHRKALLAAVLTWAVMMAGFAWLFASRQVLRSSLFPATSSLIAVLIVVLAVGGELLSERQRGGLAWLERLPAGLGAPFWAKLAFHVTTATLGGLVGFALAFPVAWLRGAAPEPLDAHFVYPALCAVPIVLWTFAASSWSARSVLSFLSAALVLAVLAFPAWRVIHAGYQPTTKEFVLFVALFASGAPLAAWIGFVHGGRLGRSVLNSALLGLTPAFFALVLTGGLSMKRMAEREVFDPLADDFRPLIQTITEDGRTAFLFGGNEPMRWDRMALSRRFLRVDLEHGSFEELGRFDITAIDNFWNVYFRRPIEDENGPTEHDELVVVPDDREPLAFDLRTGEPRTWEARKGPRQRMSWMGLGRLELDARGQSVIHDPFRGRDYLFRSFGDLNLRGPLWVRPGRWLHRAGAANWLWYEPDTGAEESVAWPAHSAPLVLFQDGRILLANAAEGLQVIHPERGEVRTLEGLDVRVDHIVGNWNGFHAPTGDGEACSSGTIVLQTNDDGWLVLDEWATSVRRLSVDDGVRILRRLGPDTAMVENWNDGDRIARLDLVSGELTPLWPPPAAPAAAR